MTSPIAIIPNQCVVLKRIFAKDAPVDIELLAKLLIFEEDYFAIDNTTKAAN